MSMKKKKTESVDDFAQRYFGSIGDDMDFATVGFDKTVHWTDTGSYALNRIMNGTFFRATKYGTFAVLSGESDSGKSLGAAWWLRTEMNAGGCRGFWFDNEKANTDSSYFKRLGLDPKAPNFHYARLGKIEDQKKYIADTIKMYDEEVIHNPDVKYFVVIDSLTVLMTAKKAEEAEKGNSVGDQGQTAKQLKDLIQAILHGIDGRKIAVIGIAHSMASQDRYSPDETITGGRGLFYLATVIAVMAKGKLAAKNVENTSLLPEVYTETSNVGHRSRIKIYKTRYGKPYQTTTLQAIMPHGYDPYSGLIELLKDEGYVKSTGGPWYTCSVECDGVPEKWMKKDFYELGKPIMEGIMKHEAEAVGISYEDYASKTSSASAIQAIENSETDMGDKDIDLSEVHDLGLEDDPVETH